MVIPELVVSLCSPTSLAAGCIQELGTPRSPSDGTDSRGGNYGAQVPHFGERRFEPFELVMSRYRFKA